jgi:exopolysaccharide biosynthesis WecB/TagA/CpsF family protein
MVAVGATVGAAEETLGFDAHLAAESGQELGTTSIGGLQTIVATRAQLAERMVSDCLRSRALPSTLPKLVFSSNGQGLSLMHRSAAFRSAMNAAEIVHADGMSVVAASRVSGKHPLPERIATTDFFHDAAQAAVKHDLRFFFLGSNASQNARAVAAAQSMHPGLKIAGWQHGYFHPDETESVCRRIRDAGTDVLWLGLGKPKQEFWALQYRKHLRGVGWIKTCGGLFAFLAGDVRRAPRWVQKSGLEWGYRMMQEPGRLGGRYLFTNLHAAWILMRP